jgi:hypothetical protein
MSRLFEMLKKALQTTPPSMGFRPVAAAGKPHMALLGTVTSVESLAPGALDEADAVVFYSGSAPTVKWFKLAAKAAGNKPWGLRLGGADKTLEQAESAGADFVVFEPALMNLAVLEYQKLGRVIVAGASMEDSLIRAGAELPFEAVVVEFNAPEISWQDLMLLRRTSDLLPKPLLVKLLGDIKTSALEALWEGGVDGVMAPADSVSGLKGLRENITRASFSERRKWMKMRPLVPLLREESGPFTHEDEDEEDGDEDQV